jgi:IS30 family transposase
MENKQYVKEQLLKGRTVTSIAKELNIVRSTFSGQLRKNRDFFEFHFTKRADAKAQAIKDIKENETKNYLK